MLSKRQHERFTEHLSKMESSEIRAAGLSTKTCYEKLIEAMKSSNWYVQNPAIDLIVSNGSDQAAELNEEQQVNLGRNILQAGEGTAGSANTFLENLATDGTSWPFDIVRGIALESFTNENNDIRFKIRHIGRVVSAISHLDSSQQNKIVAQIVTSINIGNPKYSWIDRKKFDDAIDPLKNYPWAVPIVTGLQAKSFFFTGGV